MRRVTLSSTLARLLALGALTGSFAYAQPRDITLPELVGGPDGDTVRPPDMMPVPKPTVTNVDEDGQVPITKPATRRLPAPAPAQSKPVTKTPTAARSKPSSAAVIASARVKPSPPKGKPEMPTQVASARVQPPPAAKPAPPLRTVPFGRTATQTAPARVALPDDPAAAPDLAALPEPEAEVAEAELVPDNTPSPPEASGEAVQQPVQAQRQTQGFGPDFAEIEATIQRGVRRGDFSRRQAASLYAELDDIAAMDDYYRRGRGGASERAQVAERLADLRNWLAREAPY